MEKYIIRVENLRRDFVVGGETVHALRGVSFSIREGEFVTIMGTSGSGDRGRILPGRDFGARDES